MEQGRTLNVDSLSGRKAESPGRDPVHITVLLHYTESGVFETLVITHKRRNNPSTPSNSSGRYPVCRLLFPLPYLLTTSAQSMECGYDENCP